MTEHPQGLELAHLPRLPDGEVRHLWVNDFWDGPLEGLAEYHGERCLYVVAEPDRIAAHDEERRWVLYRLTAEQLREEEHWQALFVLHVGGNPGQTGAAAGERHPELFYEPYQAQYRPPRLAREQALGWFDAFTP
ncbi:hypothetical protein [Pyxidicoccus trucidator]|uniref:hypothetical protein n=1 Tax=Pyxidicoccus trucidator TaxID=2709662 RepID=UPI0013DCA3F1|nr:hypothetical protein [Pyxidicoccus trucidator]